MTGFVGASIDAKEFQRWARRRGIRLPVIRQVLYDNLEQVSNAIMNRVKDEMPIDTGRARRSWGKDSGFGGSPKNPFRPTDPIWETNWRGSRKRYGSLYIEQGTNLPYIDKLNEGYFSQAPAGFLDAIEEAMQDDLEDSLIVELIERLFE